MRKTRISHFKKYYDYVAPVTKNRWLYRIELAHNGKLNEFIMLSYFHTSNKNYAAILVYEHGEKMIYFTKHFFERYDQRKNLNLDSRTKIMTAFLDDNSTMAIQFDATENKNSPEVFAQMKHGVGLGRFHQKLNLIELRTFISNEMLKGDQVEISKSLSDTFNLPIELNGQIIQKPVVNPEYLPPHIIIDKTMVIKHF
jgi:predicted glutamine amidotransferase